MLVSPATAGGFISVNNKEIIPLLREAYVRCEDRTEEAVQYVLEKTLHRLTENRTQ